MNAKSDFVVDSVSNIRKKAEECGGEYYTTTYAKVENPLTIHEKEKLIKEIYNDFLKYKSSCKTSNEKKFYDTFFSKFIAENPKKKQMVEFTHKTLFDKLLKRKADPRIWDAVQYMIQTKKKEMSSDVSEAEKDKIVGKMQNDLFNSSLRPSR